MGPLELRKYFGKSLSGPDEQGKFVPYSTPGPDLVFEAAGFTFIPAVFPGSVDAWPSVPPSVEFAILHKTHTSLKFLCPMARAPAPSGFIAQLGSPPQSANATPEPVIAATAIINGKNLFFTRYHPV
jgi:hypothetical protein